MKITFEITPYSNPDAFAEWLQALGYSAERINPDSSEHDVAEAKTLLLGYHHPEVALQAAMQQGEPPMQAMLAYVEKAQQLVDLFKSNRRRATLINLDDLHHAPHQACQHLMAHWGADNDVPEQVRSLPQPAGMADTSQAQAESVMFRLLARETVRESQQWPELSTQLEVCSLPLLSNDAVYDENKHNTPDEQFRRWQVAHKLQAECKEENDLLVQQLQRVKEELKISEESAKNKARVEEESRLLLEQLHLVQEELERRVLSGQEQESAERTRILTMAGTLQKKARGQGRQVQKSIKREYKLLAISDLFDQDWYLKQYPDVAEAGVDPITHYLKAGAGEGRNPSANFDTTWYLVTYPDVVASGFNPLVHFIRFGRQELRSPHPNLPALPAPAKAADNAS